jgi:serine/threonine-protein kinase RsbW
VNFIDSTGLGAILGVLKRMPKGSDLAICGATSSVSSMFKLTRMDRVFTICKTVDDAVTALSHWSRQDFRLPQITLTIASRLDAVSLLGQSVGSICRNAGLTPDEANEVEICVVEAVNNSIKHAYCEDPNHVVEVVVAVEPAELILDIWDSGESAEHSKIHADHLHTLDVDPSHPEDLAERGRGIAIIQHIMDSFEYTPGSERNRLRLTKRLRSE